MNIQLNQLFSIAKYDESGRAFVTAHDVAHLVHPRVTDREYYGLRMSVGQRLSALGALKGKQRMVNGDRFIPWYIGKDPLLG